MSIDHEPRPKFGTHQGEYLKDRATKLIAKLSKDTSRQIAAWCAENGVDPRSVVLGTEVTGTVLKITVREVTADGVFSVDL